MHSRSIWIVVALVLWIILSVPLRRGGVSVPLDLPSGGRGSAQGEEDPKETIRFFGASYEGDGFFFLLDRSGSMTGTKLEILKVEMASAIGELSEESEFGLVAFSGDLDAFAPHPVPATESQRSFAESWVNALGAYGSTMMLAGAVELLEIAYTSTKEERAIIVVGDGTPNNPGPEETREGILAANVDGLPIHTIFIGSDPEAAAFMSSLSAETGATFRQPTF